MRLKWNNLECGWECSECGALYGENEVERIFGYNPQTAENFNKGYHCMDCGREFDEVDEKTDN